MSNAVVKSKVAASADGGEIPGLPKPPGGLIIVPLLFLSGVGARALAYDVLPWQIDLPSQGGAQQVALLLLAAAWVRAFRAHDRGVAWAASTRAKLEYEWTIIARDEGSMLGDDLESARVQRNRTEERNAAYRIARTAYEFFLLGALACTFAAILCAGAAIATSGLNLQAKIDLAIVAMIGAGLILRPMIKLYDTIRRSRELSLQDKEAIDADNVQRRYAADKARVCSQFYDDFMRAPRGPG